MRVIKWMFLVVIFMMMAMAMMMFVYTARDRQIDYEVSTDGIDIPKYNSIELAHEQSHSDATSLPFTAGAAIDVDGDGVQELFIGGGHLQQDVLYKYSNGDFTEIANAGGINKPADASSTLGALVLDVDQDADEDLIITPAGRTDE